VTREGRSRRKLLQLVVSNSTWKHGRLALELHAPFDLILKEPTKAREADAKDLAQGIKRDASKTGGASLTSLELAAGFTLKVMGSLAHDLIGTWRLRSRIDRDASGGPVDEPTLGSDPLALLFFDGAGNFAAQFMKRDRSVAVAAPAFTGQNNITGIGGHDAYFGIYEVDETSGDVHTRLVGALSPAMWGRP
jgi:hypothetical protein